MDFAYADEFVRALDSSNTSGAVTSSRKHQHPCRGEVLPPTPAFQPSLLPCCRNTPVKLQSVPESNRAPGARVSAVISIGRSARHGNSDGRA